MSFCIMQPMTESQDQFAAYIATEAVEVLEDYFGEGQAIDGEFVKSRDECPLLSTCGTNRFFYLTYQSG